MIGLVLVTHGRLADEFKAALEHVMGPQKQIEAVTIGAEDDSDLCRSDIIEAVNRVDSGDGVAILTDMFGGTPSNLAISCMSRPKVEVLARRHRHGPGSRPQIRDHCQSGSRRQMSDDAASPENDPGPSVPSGAVSREIPIINKRGLHARASAKFVQMVERFNAEVWVTRGGETVGGTSIMGLMMLSAGPGTTIVVSAIGPEAQAAVDAVTELVASKFNEEST
jgi:phosphocarrier protein